MKTITTERIIIILLSASLVYSWWVQRQVDDYISEQVMESATLAFESGYRMADPTADSIEVSFYVEWYRDAIHPDSTAYCVKQGTPIYDQKLTD